MKENRYAVVYLARKVDGTRFLPRFLASLQEHHPGQQYDLIVILKGFAEGDAPNYLRYFCASGLQKVLTMNFDDKRFATEAFFTAAENFNHRAFLFFVSSSRVLAPNWGAIIFTPLIKGEAQLVGASSGFEALNETTPFPNPSLRTTGFAMLRQDWLALERGDLSIRYGGNLFEAGLDSMTKQVLRKGGKAILVGRNGEIYSPTEWLNSNTFRLSRQEGLLFSDNRTEQFDLASRDKRKKLAVANWGETVPIMEVPTLHIYIRRVRTKLHRLFWQTVGRWIIIRSSAVSKSKA